MSSPQDVQKLLYAYARRHRSAHMRLSDLVAFANEYIEKNPSDELADLEDNPENVLTAHLIALEQEGRCNLSYREGRPVAVHYPRFYTELIRAAYNKLDQRPDLPFPSEESLKIDLPTELVHAVSVKNDFVEWLAQNESDDSIIRLVFPDNVKPVIATTDMLARKLADVSVHKLRDYMRSERNSSYVKSKLAGQFPGREVALKDMLNKIQVNPDEMLETIMNPTDFTFQVWTTLSSVIIKDYGTKEEKLQEEHDYCRGANLIGYYNVYYKGVQQRNRDTEQALRTLDAKLKEEPYAFTITDIYNFTDSKGVQLTKRYSQKHVQDYLSERIRPNPQTGLPELFRLRGPNEKDYYIRNEFVLKKAIEDSYNAGSEFKEHYVDHWFEEMNNDRRPKEMVDESEFQKDVERKLRTERPLLYSLLDFRTLYLSATTNNPGRRPDELKHILDFDNQKLKPYPEILEIERTQLHQDARLLLPFWKAVPILNSLVKLFRRLFVGPSEQERERKRREKMKRRLDGKSAAGTAKHGAGEGSMNVGTKRLGPATGETATATDSGRPTRGSASGGTSGSGATGSGGSSTTNKARAVEFKKAVRKLQSHYVGSSGSVDKTLEELIEEWNPLLDEQAKKNLVEDVNSLVRDFLRRMKVGFRLIPPDKARIQNLAAQLSGNAAFDQIRRKDALKKYLELYMLKVLGK